MTLWITTKLTAAFFAIGAIALIKWASGADAMKAAVIYLVAWTVFYDGRVISDFYREFDSAWRDRAP
jgi:hypothetical protein